jgi:hypothetical protein
MSESTFRKKKEKPSKPRPGFISKATFTKSDTSPDCRQGEGASSGTSHHIRCLQVQHAQQYCFSEQFPMISFHGLQFHSMGGTMASAHVKSEDYSVKSLPSFHLPGNSGNQTQVTRLAHQVPSPTEPCVLPLPHHFLIKTHKHTHPVTEPVCPFFCDPKSISVSRL